ncbi:site-specific DNA-methyltransferase [[Haemophilus] felis]|uniref:site-specific DNA-methyltransferase (adenine-specific) n=1 Tax=[Haemophilus] felis TaxID=123822 RepID=A0A1T0AY26_9PAST|nr:site-specific DNA-methyltransferase [[Haemophilus] felis]OOS02702.1 site-specific DNA-methyltransferase [[Haemophilus] felis]
MPILSWHGKEDAVKKSRKTPYRLLREVTELSYHLISQSEAGELISPVKENLIIQGDNLAALKSLLPFYAGQVKCIYIDPPYNTGSAFTHYDDNLEHSLWLSLMYPRLELLRELLSEDGSIWISIDADESHYLKLICDEIFGRTNFIDEVIWQRSYSPINLKKTLSRSHDIILAYAKNKKPEFTLNKLPRSEEANARYKNPDNDPRGVWTSDNLSVGPAVENNIYEITTPNGRRVLPPQGRSWVLSRERFAEFVTDNRIWFGEDGKNVPRIKRFLSEVKDGVVAQTLWTYQEVGHTQDAKKEVKEFNSEEVFDTPKPEKLIQRILHLATNENDLILDSFLGSGTTAAVAHKMNRRYIGIEIGEHAKTHVVPRLKKVIEGEQGGISKAVNWQGGGGFRFCELGETVFDEWGAINSSIKFDDLAAHIWYTENHFPLPALQKNAEKSPLIGVHNGKAFYLLFNGILGDKRPQGGNVLTSLMLKALPRLDELVQAGLEIVVYGESCRLASKKLAEYHITFKLIPHDVSAK